MKRIIVSTTVLYFLISNQIQAQSAISTEPFKTEIVKENISPAYRITHFEMDSLLRKTNLNGIIRNCWDLWEYKDKVLNAEDPLAEAMHVLNDVKVPFQPIRSALHIRLGITGNDKKDKRDALDGALTRFVLNMYDETLDIIIEEKSQFTPPYNKNTQNELNTILEKTGVGRLLTDSDDLQSYSDHKSETNTFGLFSEVYFNLLHNSKFQLQDVKSMISGWIEPCSREKLDTLIAIYTIAMLDNHPYYIPNKKAMKVLKDTGFKKIIDGNLDAITKNYGEKTFGEKYDFLNDFFNQKDSTAVRNARANGTAADAFYSAIPYIDKISYDTRKDKIVEMPLIKE